MPIYMKIDGVKGDIPAAGDPANGIIAILIGLVRDDRFDFEAAVAAARGGVKLGLGDVDGDGAEDFAFIASGRDSAGESYLIMEKYDATAKGLMGDVPWKDGPFASIGSDGDGLEDYLG